MNWFLRAINWLFYEFGATTIITMGASILTLLIVIPTLYFESKARNRKDD